MLTEFTMGCAGDTRPAWLSLTHPGPQLLDLFCSHLQESHARQERELKLGRSQFSDGSSSLIQMVLTYFSCARILENGNIFMSPDTVTAGLAFWSVYHSVQGLCLGTESKPCFVFLSLSSPMPQHGPFLPRR